jgi:hypothetical protein
MEKRMIKQFVTTLLCGVLMSCSSEKTSGEMFKCVSNLADVNSKSAEGIEFVSQLEDSLHSWGKNIDIFFMETYKENRYHVSDKVLFNSDKTKGIGFSIEPRQEGEANDFVQIITGEILNGNWQFYYLGNPTLLFTKCDGCEKQNEPLMVEEIERGMLQNVLERGYLKKDCVIDDKAFEDKWVTEFKRNDHKYRFLTSTYPKYHESFYRDGVKLPL